MPHYPSTDALAVAMREEQRAPERWSALREREGKRERRRRGELLLAESRDVYSNNLNETDLLPTLFDAGLPQREKRR